ncbi:MAG TPA: branched-chain amino acid ABC transporter substrate-binding protein [Burkholderiaceae bacterium]|nr:branched-chain amino acid ABC transporter substrate-binding protein [Burkholderiaceae bacterium]
MHLGFVRTVLASAIALAFSGTVAAQEQTITIGHVAPTSGQIAHLGKDSENGARMAIDEVNAKEPVIGGKKVKFVLMTEDDAADPKQGTAVAQKFVDAKVNGVIGHLTSGTSIPASKIYSDAGIPQISPAATNPKYTQQGYKTTFRVVASDSRLGAALGKYAVTDLKLKNIAVIDDRSAYGQGLAEQFAKAAKAAGGKIVSQQYTTEKSVDLNSQLTAIKAKKPDLIFFGGTDAVATPMLRQMKQLGLNAKLMGGDGICTETMAKLAGDAFTDGQVICAEPGGIQEGQKRQMDTFREQYKQKFNQDVVIYAPYTYDATMAMISAMQKAGSADPAKYLPALAKGKQPGVTGTIAFDAHGDIIDGSLTLYALAEHQRKLIAVTK